MTQLGAESGASSAGPLFEPAREARRQESPPAIHLGPGTNLSLLKIELTTGRLRRPVVCEGPEGPGWQGPRFAGPVLLLYDWFKEI